MPDSIQENLFPDCPVRNVLARVADKWSLLLLHELQQRGLPMRFSELQRAVPDISQKMLTTTLRHLEADGFLLRRVYAEVPPKTEYSLTSACRFFPCRLRPHAAMGLGAPCRHPCRPQGEGQAQGLRRNCPAFQP